MDSTDESSPTPQEWSELYRVAVAFRDLAPWRWMWDADMFGVRNPETGEIAYCSIMGRLGEHFALAACEGSEGLAGLWRMREGDFDTPVDMLMYQKCLMASFEDRNQLQKPDLDQIKALGLKFRGRNAWPQFRSYLPGYQPWYLTGPQARFLTLVLQQALDVTERFREDPTLLPEATPNGKYLVRERRADGSWQDAYVVPEPVSPKAAVAAPLDEITTARAQRLTSLPKTRGTLEMDFFTMPGAVKGENGGRPYFPYVLLAADPASGMILNTDIVKPDDLPSALAHSLLDIVEQVGRLPAKVLVGQEEALTILQPVGNLLGIQISKVRRLRAIEEARNDLSAFMGFAPNF